MEVVKELGDNMPEASPGGMIDVAGMVAVKTVIEAISAPYMGNDSLKAAGIKLVAAMAIDKFVGGKYGRILAGGMVFDGAEDALAATGLADLASGIGTKLGGGAETATADTEGW